MCSLLEIPFLQLAWHLWTWKMSCHKAPPPACGLRPRPADRLNPSRSQFSRLPWPFDRLELVRHLGPPAIGALLPYMFLVGEASPTEIDYRKKGYPCSNLSTGGPRPGQATGLDWSYAMQIPGTPIYFTRRPGVQTTIETMGIHSNYHGLPKHCHHPNWVNPSFLMGVEP